ncbi:XkdQ/YqbQ family protein [Lacrimispora sp. 38-1]|uniref:XkdQ/YqbQ family protein n=1 Tax=Lacrimispora sp. 38-1 TaxID=3125778 RepID=UPI003CE8BE5E
MNYKLLIFNAESNTMYDYAPITEKITYTTNRSGSAGKLTFSFIQKKAINLTEGAKVQFYVDGIGVFLGFVFVTEQDRWGEVSVTAYDQLRYLKSTASYSIEGKKLNEIIQQIATDMQLQIGTLEDTEYIIPTLTKESTECLDIIEYGLQLTQYNTGRTFVFYDNFGKLCLTEAKNLMSDILIGNGSIVTDYTYKSDIDSDTYNQVRLVRPNKETGQGDTYNFSDSTTIKKWGLLQKYVKVDENLNEAQINEQGNIMMAYYDRVLKTISIDGVGGVPGLKAGAMAKFKIKDVPELSEGLFLLLDKVKHTFSNGEHTMNLEAKIINI